MDRWDSIDRYVVISADTHAGADVLGYRPYLESRFHDEFDAWAASYESPYDDLVDATANRNWDSDVRQADLEAEGVVAEVVLPNTVPPFLSTIQNFASFPKSSTEYEYRWAGIKAHNRWLVDFCQATPGRRRGTFQIMPIVVDEALAEIRFAADSGIAAGILLPHPPPNDALLPPLFDEHYEPIWALCAELGLPVIQHAGTGVPDYPADNLAAGPALFNEFTEPAQRDLRHVIFGAVFERYPDLKYVMTEQGGIGPVMDQVATYPLHDLANVDSGRTVKLFYTREFLDQFSMNGEGYARRNCFVANFDDLDRRHEIGVSNVMFGTDYPHEEGTQPNTKMRLRVGYWDKPVDECRKMLAGNAAEVFGFDLEALTPLAMQHGPTLEEIHTEPSADDFAEAYSGLMKMAMATMGARAMGAAVG